jgi:hypothetical protein
MLLQFDEAGTMLTDPKAVVELSPGPEAARLAWHGSGYLTAWDDYAPNAEPAKLWALLLDETGDAVGSPRAVAEGADLVLGSLVATEKGFALTYSTVAADGSSSVWYQALDETTGASGPAYELGRTDGKLMTSLVAHGSEVVVAWTQCERWQCAVKLQRMDEQGRPLGAMYALDSPEGGETDGRVALLGFDEDIAVIWSHGPKNSEIPDYDLHWVILDGTKLTPVSELLVLTRPLSGTRLTRPQAVRLGSDVLVLSDVDSDFDVDAQDHPDSAVASGVIRCTR